MSDKKINVEVLRKFIDKFTKKEHELGDKIKLTKERANELSAKRFVRIEATEEVEKTKKD